MRLGFAKRLLAVPENSLETEEMKMAKEEGSCCRAIFNETASLHTSIGEKRTNNIGTVARLFKWMHTVVESLILRHYERSYD